ncbi:THO complex subunit 2 [Epicoccum nigrum]|nr:THO complex subunit 2 [Epicoccum nigrum]
MGPAASGSSTPGIHPSRQQALFGGSRPNVPPIQADMSGAPSGPRGGRMPQGSLPSPGGRPPTGPAFSNDRTQRNPNALRNINNVLNQNAPSPTEWSAPAQGSPAPVTVRGRGANRANGPSDGQDSPMPPPQHTATPNTRTDGSHSRPGGEQHEERSESRSRRSDGRREERSGRDRDHEKRSDERSSRNGPSQSREPGQEQERGERREKRGGDRESSRRHGEERSSREGGGERSSRETREPREPREGKPHRSSRDEGRPSGSSGREERDRRSRGGGSSAGDDGRKRIRDPADQPHGDSKRRRP